MTPPLLAEDLLLVLFDPESGAIRAEGTPLFHTLAGAVLAELASDGHVELDDRTTMRGRQVRAVGTAPDDPLLRDIWQRLAAQPLDVQALIVTIGPPLRAALLERLVERDLLRREGRRLLGLLPTTRLVDAGRPRRSQLVGAVRAVLVDGADPDARTGLLAALLSASGALPQLHAEIPWTGPVATRGQQMQRGDWGAAAAADAVAMTTATLLSTSLFVTMSLPGES